MLAFLYVANSKYGDFLDQEQTEKYFLASIVESSQDSIISVDSQLTITSWNSAAEQLYGYTAGDAIGRQLTTLTRDQDIKTITRKVKQVMANKRIAVFDTERIGNGNKKLHLEVVMSPIRHDDGTIIGVSTIARDISLRRQAEKAHRERELLYRVLTAQEDERSRLARDLHDQIGQAVTALRLRLKLATGDCSDEPGKGHLSAMEQLIEEIDRSVDFIAWELRPTPLDGDHSLTSAINNYTRQWSRHTGIPVKRIPELRGRLRLLSVVDTNLYRIMQEALNNIQKHAKASEVEVSLKKRGNSLVLVISDNGKGFNPKSRRKSRHGFGLVGMKERAALIGATIEIESSRGTGTTIYVRVPDHAEISTDPTGLVTA